MNVPAELVDLFDAARAEHAGDTSADIHGEHAALAAVVAKVRAVERAEAAAEFEAYRCDYELCGMCTCRADLVKLLRGES